MNSTAGTVESEKSAQLVDKLYMENTLLRIAGALFCHDAKRASTLIETIEVDNGNNEKKFVIEPHPNYGRPGPLAHKLFVAIIKKHSNYGRPVPSEISFTKREIMRLIGRTQWGGRDSVQLSRALREIQSAFVTCYFKTHDGSQKEHRFNIFPEIYLERSGAAENAPIESCMLTLASPIVASLRDQHFTCLNHFFMLQLGTIGQALYMRLVFHFSNLFDGHHRDRVTFTKRYDDICSEWLGGIMPRPHLSAIERDQLGPHLRQLVTEHFLASFQIIKAKTRDGYVLVARPGAAFFEQYDQYYRHRHQGGLQFVFHDEQKSIGEPLRVAYLFVKKRTGQGTEKIAGISRKDKEAAQAILECLPYAQIEEFLDYALAKAKQTNFDVQTLSGLKPYVPAFVQHRQHLARSKAQATLRRREEHEADLKLAYDRFCTDQAKILFQSLTVAERAIVDGLAQAGSRNRSFGVGSIDSFIKDRTRNRITLERYGNIPNFGVWKARLPAAVVEQQDRFDAA